MNYKIFDKRAKMVSSQLEKGDFFVFDCGAEREHVYLRTDQGYLSLKYYTHKTFDFSFIDLPVYVVNVSREPEFVML